MHTPAEIYAMPPQEVSHDLRYLAGCYYNHLEELTALGFFNLSGDLANITASRVEIKIVKYVNFDGRRFWRLATVWFDGKPVMIIQNAGREGDDHFQRFITDLAAYKKLVAFVLSLLPERLDYAQAEKDCVDPAVPREDLTRFFSHDLATVSNRIY